LKEAVLTISTGLLDRSTPDFLALSVMVYLILTTPREAGYLR
jgi:hypothetical protein